MQASAQLVGWHVHEVPPLPPLIGDDPGRAEDGDDAGHPEDLRPPHEHVR